LFFAAASNFGANGQELFPANHESVTSVRATDHFGTSLPFNPPPPRQEWRVFGTLGNNVPCARLGPDETEISVTGTSIATPIFAGTAALVLAYARLCLADEGKDENNHKWKGLWTKSGIENVFEQLSNHTQVERFRYLSPDSFINTSVSDEKRKRMLDNAVQDL
jgi:hypothetical protein